MKTYKVVYFCPNSPRHLEAFLEDQLEDGLELIAATGDYFATGDYYIFKRSTLTSSQHPSLDRFPFIPEDLPLIEE